MKRLSKDNKGFTLIELLAVIVILGVLMIAAIPMVSRYIRESRQNAFISTAKAYIDSARYAYLNGDYTDPESTSPGAACATLDSGTGGTVYIRFKYIAVERTGSKSSFGKTIDFENSYVKITSDSTGKYTYSVYMRDTGDNGLNAEIVEKDLDRSKVTTGTTANPTGSNKLEPLKACKGASLYNS